MKSSKKSAKKKQPVVQKEEPKNEIIEEPVAQQPAKKPFWKRRWVVGLAVSLLLFLLLLVFGVPLGAKYYLTDWLKKNGADYAKIEKISWNPFTGQLWLGGVDLSEKGQVLMKQVDLSLNLELSALLSKNIDLTSVTYRGLDLELEQLADGGWKVATISIPESGENQAPVGETTTAKPDNSSAQPSAKGESVDSSWAVLADNVNLENCQVHYKSPLLDLTVKVDDAKLNKFSTRSGSESGTLLLHGSVNGEPLTIDLSKIQITPALALAGKIDISKFDLNQIDTILKDALPYFSGDAAVKGAVDFSMKDGEIDVSYEGSINVDKADVGSESFRTKASRLNYTGKVHYAMPKNAPMTVDTDGVLQADGYLLKVPGADLDTTEKLVKLSGVTNVKIGDGVVVNNNGKLQISAIGFTMPMLQATTKDFNWSGKVHYDLAKSNLVDTDGTLKLSAIEYSMPEPEMKVGNDSFKWQGKILYQGLRGGNANVVETDGAVELKPLDFAIGPQSAKTTLATALLGYAGKLSFAQQKEGSKISVDGTLNGAETAVALESAGIEIKEKKLDLKSTSDVTFGKTLNFKGESSLNAGEFSLTMKGESPLVTAKSIALGKFEGLGEKALSAESLVVTEVQADIPGDTPLQITTPEVKLDNFSTEDLEKFSLKQLALKEPLVYSPNSESDIVKLKDITLEGVAATTTGDADVDSLNFNELILLAAPKKSSDPSVLTLGQAKLKGIRWSNKDGFEGAALDFTDLVANVINEKKGGLNVTNRLALMQKSSAKKAEKQAAPTVKKTATTAKKATKKGANEGLALPVQFKLGEVLIGGNSELSFSDYSLKSPFKTTLNLQKLHIDKIDSRKPADKTALTLVGMMDKRAPLKVSGDIEPLLQNIGINLNVNLKNYPLQNLSPYVARAIGTGLASGEMFVDTKMALNNNYLKMDNKLLLKKLVTKVVSKDLTEKVSGSLPVPLDVALSILRDNDDNIELSVPLEGDLASLHVGLADVIMTALGKAVVPALTGYAVYALGPYGALAYVGMKLGEDLLKEGSTPVIFMQGKTELVAEQKKELDDIGKKMAKNKDDMQVCPYVASWEFMTKEQIDAAKGSTIPTPEADKDRLDALGQTRAANVQNYLAETYQIDKDRLLLCTTVIKEEKKMLPLVALHK